MEIIDFRFLTTDDNYNAKWDCWSRVYEYEYILNKLKELGASSTSTIHNSSWGFEGCHVTFKEQLDASYDNCLHSDIRHSSLPKTMYYDITKPIEDKYKNYFDFVINVSTVEEVGYDNVKIIRNLLEQVKVGGHLIITFDYIKNSTTEGNGSINLNAVSEFINKEISDSNPDKNITGNNSVMPQTMWSHLQCGALIIHKTSN